MSSISDDGTTAPPPGLSKEQLSAVAESRALVKHDIGGTASVALLGELLSAYETLAARMAWLAAEHAGCEL